jgi:ribosome-binding factor A
VLGAEPETAAKLLNDKAGYFHSLLFKRLQIHTVPALKFVHDASVEKGFEIDKLIANAVAPASPKRKLRPDPGSSPGEGLRPEPDEGE